MKPATMAAVAVGSVAAVGATLFLVSKASAQRPALPEGGGGNAPEEEPDGKPDADGDDAPDAPGDGDDAPAGGGGAAPSGDTKPGGNAAPGGNVVALSMVTVANAQGWLNALGAKLKKDGLYGKNTANAWAAAAKKRKLTPDFVRHDGKNARAAATTIAKLKADAEAAQKTAAKKITDAEAKKRADADYAAAKKAAQQAAAKDKAAVDAAKKPGAKPAPKPGVPAPAPAGQQDVLVLAAQTHLIALGAKLERDGKFGPKTRDAWNAAAKKRGQAEGFVRLGPERARVNAKTAARIQADAAAANKGKPAPAPAPKPKPNTAPAPKPNAPAPGVATINVAVLEVQKTLNRVAGKGLATDGLYGPKTAAAWADVATKNRQNPLLEKIDSKNVRIALDTAKAIDALPSYGFDRVKARGQAKDIAAMLKSQGKAYQKSRLKSWQVFAGIDADGLYGPLTKSALEHFGASPPAAFVAGKQTTYREP